MPAGGHGSGRPAGRGRGIAPLCGAGMRPPLFFRPAERKVAAAAVEKKGAFSAKPAQGLALRLICLKRKLPQSVPV